MQELWNIAVQHHRAGRLDQAEQSYRRLLLQAPDNIQLLQALAQACYEQKKTSESIGFLQQACRIAPGNTGLRYSLAAILALSGRAQDAVNQYQAILQEHPGHGPSLVGMGIRHFQQLEYSAAIEYFKKAIASNSIDAEAHYNLGLARMRIGQSREADNCFRKALACKPGFVEAETCRLFNLHNIPDVTDAQLLAAHIDWAKHYTTPAHTNDLPVQLSTLPGRPLRIGYVSPDFRQHSVAYFIIPVLEAHNRQKVDCFCYSNVSQPDTTTEYIRGLADHWRDIYELNDKRTARLIRDDRIDILVDLAGHTSGNRLPVFALRPAPVQVTWMGYPGTTGLPAMDYKITDEHADPTGTSDTHHTETLSRAASCFLCYQPLDEIQPPYKLPVDENGYITFGSFNNLSKYTEDTIALWADILRNVPGARLLLKAKGLGDTAGQQSVVSAFAANGVAADRIECIGHIHDPRDHLELYNRIDIALDTFPYNGTTTTCEALWMGVPVITLAGTRHASRVGASLLTAAAVTGLITDSPANYIATATRLAKNTNKLKQLKQDLHGRIRTSNLMDKAAFTDNLEQLYLEMVETSKKKYI